MCAGLQGHPGRSSMSLVAKRVRVAQRHDLRVWTSSLLGRALADDPTIRETQHATHPRVGFGQAKRALSQEQGFLQPKLVQRGQRMQRIVQGRLVA